MVGKYHTILIKYLFDNCNKLKPHCDPDHPDPAVAAALKTLNFEEGQEQDYSNPRIQELYVLRYTYSYAYEYREMFLRFMRGESIPAFWDILSLGCGNGIDYWAAREAQTMGELLTPKHIRYTGVDLVKWNLRWGEDYLSMRSDARYETSDVVDYLQGHPVLPHNIIVFPKSISEFPEDVFEKILDAFASAKFQFGYSGKQQIRDQVHFMVSFRTDGQTDPNELEDVKRGNRLIEAMEKNGFVLKDGAEDVLESAEDIKISDAEEGFKFPENIRSYVEELYQAGISTKRTIRSMKFMCNRIMSFERKGRL